MQKDQVEYLYRMALDHKFRTLAQIPNASQEWGWQRVFPATSDYTDMVTGEKRRHHLPESVLQRAFKEARLRRAFSSPPVRTPYAIHLLRTYSKMAMTFERVQELLGHNDVSTTMIYTHVLNRGGKGVRSPADAL